MCHETKPLAAFWRNGSAKAVRYEQGRMSMCIPCNKTYTAIRKNSPEVRKRMTAVHRAWVTKNADRLRAYVSKFLRTDKRRFSGLRAAAKRRGLDCEITLDQFTALIRSPCEYCKGPLPTIGHGLDRADNGRGYTADNVVPCCGPCNHVKGSAFTHSEMRRLGAVIAELRAEGKWTKAA